MAAPRPLFAALALAAALGGCRLSPAGSCGADADCEPGRHCAEDVCVPDGRSELYAGCVVDRDCDPHAQCTRGVCVLGPGRCAGPADCATWESCEWNVCVPLPGRCGTLDDCAPWEICVAAASTAPALPEHRCEVAPGRCTAETAGADCAAWQVCSATRFCETGPGFCARDGDCAAWMACGADHLCALRAGACEVQEDCPADRRCDLHACVAPAPPPALDPAAVYLVGTLEPGVPGRAAIAALGAPAARLVGLAAGDLACGPRIAPDGAVVLTRGTAHARLGPDAILWDATAGAWVYPADPAANDVAQEPPPACAGAVSVVAVVQPAIDAGLLFGCDGVWMDAAGTAIGGGWPLLARGATGRFLAGSSGMVTAPALLDADGLQIPLTGEVMPDGDRLVAWRADGDGFRVVRALGAAGLADLEVWTIDGAGVTARAAALPPLPAAAVDAAAPLLDGAGAVHQLAVTAAGDGLVVKRAPAAAAAEVPYDETSLPAATSLFDAPAAVDAASCLVTGP